MRACRLIFTSIKRLLGGRGGCIRSEGEIWTHEKETALNSSSECDRFPFRCRQLTERDHRSEAAAWMDDT